MAEIQFSRGTVEETVPNVRLTRSRDGSSGTATFYFQSPKILSNESTGEIVTREVKGKFINGKPEAVEAIYIMKSEEQWDRFMRFMERYAQEQGLGFSKS